MTVKIDGTNTEANPAFTGADTDTGLQCGTNELKLVTGGTARFTVESDGDVTVAAGDCNLTDGNLVVAAGHGIDFSATANSSGTVNSELLDDYEEGTWTPNWTFGGNNAGLTTSLASGTYTKIGQQVFCYGAFNLTNKGTSTGNVLITGLPFTASNQVPSTAIEGGIISAYQANFSGTHVGPLHGSVINNQTYFELYRNTSTNPGESGSVTHANVTNTTQFRFTAIYTTAS